MKSAIPPEAGQAAGTIIRVHVAGNKNKIFDPCTRNK